MVIRELRKPLTAALFVFGKDKIDVSEYEEAGILFHEMNRLNCVKMLVINDKTNYGFDGRPKNYEQQLREQAKHIIQTTKVTFDYTIFIPSAEDMKLSMKRIRETLKFHPLRRSPHLQTFEQIQEMVHGLTTDDDLLEKAKQDIEEQIVRTEVMFKALVASASTAAIASTVGGIVAGILVPFTLGASIGVGAAVVGVGAAATAGISASAAATEKKIEALKNDLENKGGVHERLKEELKHKMTSFKKLCQKLHVDVHT